MQLHVRSQARALDCVCSIISSRLHVRVKTYVYRVLRCKSCKAWHEGMSCSCCCCVWRWSRFGRITNFKIVFLILSVRPNTRCQFNRETFWFKWIKLYISNMPYPLVGFLLAPRHAHSNCDAIRTFARWRDPFLSRKKFRSSWQMPSIASSFLRLRRVSIIAIIRDEKRLFRLLASHARRGFFPRLASFFTRSLAGLKSGDEKVGSFTRAYRTLAAARTAVDVLRTRKTRKSEADGRRDNEIEMAKADHRIGWLNRGWRSRSRRTRGLIRAATALSARASLAPRN